MIELSLYTEEHLTEFLTSLEQKTVEHIVKSVMTDIHKFSSGLPQSDDITMLVIKFKGREGRDLKPEISKTQFFTFQHKRS